MGSFNIIFTLLFVLIYVNLFQVALIDALQLLDCPRSPHKMHWHRFLLKFDWNSGVEKFCVHEHHLMQSLWNVTNFSHNRYAQTVPTFFKLINFILFWKFGPKHTKFECSFIAIILWQRKVLIWNWCYV